MHAGARDHVALRLYIGCDELLPLRETKASITELHLRGTTDQCRKRFHPFTPQI